MCWKPPPMYERAAGDGFPKLCGARDGGAQASHGCAARSVFWKAIPNCPPAPSSGQVTLSQNSNIALTAQIIIISTAEIGNAIRLQFDNAGRQRRNKLPVMADENQRTRIILQRQ